MHICYLDESGDGVTLTNHNIDRAMLSFGLVGLIVNTDKLDFITNEYIDLKKKFFPSGIPMNERNRRGSWATLDIKGSHLAYELRAGSKSQKRQTIGFLDNYVELLEKYEIKILGRIWIKQPEIPVNEVSLYTVSVQKVHQHFESFLATSNSKGLVIADNRMPTQNHSVSHSIHIQRYSFLGNPYPNIVEVPTYGQSQNHTGIQLADILISGLINPITAAVFMRTIAPTNPHAQGAGCELRSRYGTRLRALQYIYKDSLNKSAGGIVVSDRNLQMSSKNLFVSQK